MKAEAREIQDGEGDRGIGDKGERDRGGGD
jgi:hypothetical protein